MIRSEELRLYNITEQGLVIAISNYEFIVESKDDQFYSSKAVTINPIPITEEWLVRLGFTKYRKQVSLNVGGELFEYWEKDKFILWCIGNDLTPDAVFRSPASPKPSLRIRYVHTLQNWWYANTGTELQIKKTYET